MNPVLGVKGWSVRTTATLLAVLTSVFLTLGCGSTSLSKANSNGFSNSSVNGTYVFSSEGSDSSTAGDLLAMAGAFTANGTGGITGGTMDIIDPSVGVAAGQTITSGSYNVNTDGRGQVHLTSAAGTFVLDFVLTSTPSGLSGVSTHGLVSEFDDHGSGSGTLDLQAAVTSLSQLAGPYAFNISGTTGSNISAATGAFTLNSGGTITAGIEDLNAAPFVYADETVTGGATLGSGTAPGSITLTTSNFSLAFDFYPINATHLKLIETDNTNFLIGDAFTQTGASIPTGPMVFTMAGGTASTGPIALGGLMTSSNGLGDFSSGFEDVNDAGSINSSQLQFSGTAAGPASTGGRVQVNLSGFAPASTWVIYPSSGGLLMLETDSNNLTVGAALAQQAGATIGATQAYGLDLAAFNTSGGGNDEDDIAQFTTSSSGFTGTVDINDNFFTGSSGNPVLTSVALSDTTALTLDSTGRCQATTASGSSPFVSFICYAVSSNTFLLLETDSNQIGVGTFESQSSTAAAAAAHPVAFMVRPADRSRAIKPRKR